MELRLQLFLIICSFIAMIIIINMVKRGSVEIKYSLVWMFAGFSLILISFFPGIIERLAIYIGVKTPVNALFLVVLAFELMIIFSLTVALSRNSVRVKKLAQELALLKKRIDEYGNQ